MNEELKSVHEVCEKTGLNRKLLFDYKDIVKPTAFSNGAEGYKLYCDDDIIKLQHIAIFRSIGISRSKIKEIMSDNNFNSIDICNQQLDLLNKKKKEIEDQIALVEQIKFFGIKSKTSNLLRAFYQNSIQTGLHFSDLLLDSEKAFSESGLEEYFNTSVDEKMDALFDDDYIITCFFKLYNAAKKRNREKINTTLCNTCDHIIINHGLCGILLFYTLLSDEVELFNDEPNLLNDEIFQEVIHLINAFISDSYYTKLNDLSAKIVKLQKYRKLNIEDYRVKNATKEFIDYLISSWGVRINEEYAYLVKLISSLEDNPEISEFIDLVLLKYSPFYNE